ncbi:MAG: hypothetical protein RL328_1816 [Acidobacteriota bacterium]
MTSASIIANNTRELVVHLSRKNGDPARALAGRVHADLNTILSSNLDSDSVQRRQAQQTMYAIEEVLALIDQRDLQGAWEAARDASKEWRTFAQVED